MFFKKATFLLPLALALVVSGCGQSSSTTSAGTANPSAEGAATTGSDKPINIILSHNAPNGNSISRAILKFKEEVESESKGRLKVQIFGEAQLGSDREQIEQTQLGSINITGHSASAVATFVKEVELLDMPFMWPSDEKMWEVAQGPVGDEMLATLSDAGLKGLSIWAISQKHFTNNEHPITGPQDLKGMGFRVIPSPMLIKQYELWGANPTPIDFGELYSALQTGVVKGQDNGLETIYTNNYHEVQKFLTLSGHNSLSYIFFANENWFNGLPEDLQAIIAKASKNAAQNHYTTRVAEEAEILQKIKDSGVQVNELSPEAKDEFKSLLQPLYDEFITTDKQKDLYKKIQEAVK